MQGSPLLRALILTASLAVMAGLIATVAGRARPEVPPLISAAAGDELPATLSVQLSAPVRSLSLTTLDGQRVLLEADRPERDAEFSLTVPLRDGQFTGLLSVIWEDPSGPNFLRLILEPETRTSREVLLHAPGNLEQHAIEFIWPLD